MSLTCLDSLIARHARYRADQPALVCGELRLDYASLHAEVERLAALLQSRGIGHGERVAAALPNGLPLLALYFACARLGAVIVPASPLLRGAGLATLLADAGASALIHHHSLADVVAAARESFELAEQRVLSVGGDYEAALAAAPAAPSGRPALASDDLFNIMYSSGTTGAPKGIEHSHRVRANYATGFAASWRMTPESVVLHSGSIVFNGAMVTLMPCFYLGAKYVLLPAFEPGAVIEAIARERVTHTMLVPSQIVALMEHPDFSADKLGSLQMLLSLGAPLLQEQKQRLDRLLPGRFHELYGLTEGFVTILDREDFARKPDSVGCPPPLFEMKIVAENGDELLPGEIGEIVGRGPLLSSGYYGRPEQTAQTFRDGWLYSGDLGYLDEDGFLYLVDRLKDMIVSGGVNVYPRDIEEIAAQHPAVLEVAVFGVPSQRWGETPIAAVVLRAGESPSAEELRDWINARVQARYQRISAVQLLEDFPRNVAGKILKRELAGKYGECGQD